MSTYDNRAESDPGNVCSEAAVSSGDLSSSAKISHELGNLLDGSLRNVNLVMSSLRDATDSDREHPDSDHDMLPRLEAVNDAMNQMAILLRRWYDHVKSPDLLHHQSHTLGQTIEHAVHLLEGAARNQCIRIKSDIEDEAAGLPAGPIYPVIANALRNGIEAMDRVDELALQPNRSIELKARVLRDQVELSVHDDGPGLDPALIDENGEFRFGRSTKSTGHGLGLCLSRDIALSLGGTLDLRNHRGGGVITTLRYPR